MEGRFSPGPTTVLGARVASHTCAVCAYQAKAHPRRDHSGRSRRSRASTHLLSTVELPGECDPRLAHPAQSGYESRVCERARGELGIGQTTDGLREARGSFASISRTEPQATPPDARVRPGARRASRELGTPPAGVAGTSDGTGDSRPVGRAWLACHQSPATGGRVGSASPTRLARSHQRGGKTRTEPLCTILSSPSTGPALTRRTSNIRTRNAGIR